MSLIVVGVVPKQPVELPAKSPEERAAKIALASEFKLAMDKAGNEYTGSDDWDLGPWTWWEQHGAELDLAYFSLEEVFDLCEYRWSDESLDCPEDAWRLLRRVLEDRRNDPYKWAAVSSRTGLTVLGALLQTAAPHELKDFALRLPGRHHLYGSETLATIRETTESVIWQIDNVTTLYIDSMQRLLRQQSGPAEAEPGSPRKRSRGLDE